MRILKYPLDLRYGDLHNIIMPAGATILTVQVQYGVLCIWAMCDDRQSSETRHIALYGTGHMIHSNPGKYIGTVQLNGGGLVLHVFDVS